MIKKLIFYIRRYYYYTTRVAWVNKQKMIRPVSEYPKRFHPIIYKTLKHDANREEYLARKYEQAHRFTTVGTFGPGTMIFAYVIGFCGVLYLILFKLVLPFILAIH